MTGSSTSSTATMWRSESPAAPTSVDHNRARSPTTGAVANPFLTTTAVTIAISAAPVHACARSALPRLSGNGGTM